MTIPSTPRKAGPILGNGVTTSFPFSFKVFAPTDVKVVIADSAGVETVLVLDSDYTVTLNANQDTSPGGTVNYPISGSPLPSGSVLSIIGNIDYDQPLDLPSGGNFSPLALENQLDRTTMQIQQLREEMDRTVKLPPTSSESVEDLVDDLQRIADSADNLDTVANNIADVNTVAANIADVTTVADNVTDITNFADVYQGGKEADPALRNDGSALQPGDLYFNTTAGRLRVFDGTVWREGNAGSITVERFSGNGSQTAFTLNTAPSDENNTQVYISGVYQQKNTYSVSGTTLTFDVAPPAGTNNIEVVVMRVLPLGNADASLISFLPAGAGAVATTVEAKLRQIVSPTDYGAVGDGSTDDTAAFTSLRTQFNDGRVVDLAGKTYVVDAFPSGPNVYVNGKFKIAGVTYEAYQDAAVISDLADTGGLDPSYTAPTETATYSPSGRSTRDKFALFASQNSRANGPGRAACVASIYSHARGNISAAVAARQGFALSPQSFVAAVEECEVLGASRNAIIGSVASSAENFMGGIIASRRAHTNGENNAVIASREAVCGTGFGAKFAVTTSNGQVTSVKVVDGGSGYVNPSLQFFDRTGPGTGATATAVVTDGVITAVTVTNGGSGYSDNTAFVSGGDYASGLAANVDCVAYDNGALCNAIIASEGAEARNKYSTVMASFNSVASGRESFVAASERGVASGERSAVIASGATAASANAQATGSNSLVAAASDAVASGIFASTIGGNFVTADNSASVVIGSRRTTNSVARSVAGGNHNTGGASTANRKWHIHSDSGDIQAAGTITGSATFTDYAEYFENLESGAIPLGTIVTLVGRKVRPVREGDDILGVVSATALVVAGDSPFTWQGRYLTGEFGELLYGDVWDEEADWDATLNHGKGGWVGGYVRAPLENPDYDPTRENIPRSERPDEWTCVALLGQVHVRVGQDVAEGDWIAAGDGVGVKSAERTNLRCMEIRRAFDAGKGYAVAFCLLR